MSSKTPEEIAKGLTPAMRRALTESASRGGWLPVGASQWRMAARMMAMHWEQRLLRRDGSVYRANDLGRAVLSAPCSPSSFRVDDCPVKQKDERA